MEDRNAEPLGGNAALKRSLTAEEREQARKLWESGQSLGEIAEAMGCSLPALTPGVSHLTADFRRKHGR